jgi:hypothetical protein
MQTKAMLPDLDDPEDAQSGRRLTGQGPGGTLGFEGGPKALHHGAIVTIGSMVHADRKMVFIEQNLLVVASKLAAAIRVMEQAAGGGPDALSFRSASTAQTAGSRHRPLLRAEHRMTLSAMLCE